MFESWQVYNYWYWAPTNSAVPANTYYTHQNRQSQLSTLNETEKQKNKEGLLFIIDIPEGMSLQEKIIP